MEPDIMSSHSCSPSPLDGDGDGGVGSEEDDFGPLSLKMACSPLGLTDAAEPTTFLSQTSPAVEPATHQPSSAVQSESDGGHTDVKRLIWNSESSLHYSNGRVQEDLESGAFSASMQSSPEEETGFADFTLFTEQAGHPWCCGFTEQWDGKVESANSSSGEHSYNSGQEFISDSELRSQRASEAKEDVCINVKHCEKRNTALVHPPQDHHQPQEAVAALSLASVEEELHIPGNTQERRCSCGLLQAFEVQRNSEKAHQTFTEDETASDEWASCNDFSFESASAALEPNVLSSASHDQADNEVKEPENCRDVDSLISSEMTNLSLSESDLHHCSHYMTQEPSATSNQSRSGTNALDSFAHFTDSNVEHHKDQEPVQTADTTGIQSLGNLPPSDSFADFCSAPTQEDEEGLWADFKDQTVPVEEKTWTQFKEQVSKPNTGKDIEEELERSEKNDVTRRNSCQASLSCRVQQLLQSSFPEVLVPVADGEEELVKLGALLQTQGLHESEEEPELSHGLRIQQLMLRPHQDLLWSLGLQFQWGDSHTKTSLLRCLGVDTRNIVFMGTKKQPVTIPAYASSLEILESTKECLPALCSPGSQRSWGRLDP